MEANYPSHAEARTEYASGVFPMEASRPEQPQPDDETTAVVAALRGVTGSHSLNAALEAGEIIFRYVFRGDENLLRARGKKCSSFRKLAAHPQLAMSTSSLWRAVAIYELSLRFPELTQYAHVGVGHISVVLGLPPADQFRLLRQAEAERWTRRKLQKVSTELRLQHRAPGTLPCSRVLESLAGLELLVRDASLDRQLELMTNDEARRALHALERIRQRFGEVEGRLRSVSY